MSNSPSITLRTSWWILVGPLSAMVHACCWSTCVGVTCAPFGPRTSLSGAQAPLPIAPETSQTLRNAPRCLPNVGTPGRLHKSVCIRTVSTLGFTANSTHESAGSTRTTKEQYHVSKRLPGSIAYRVNARRSAEEQARRGGCPRLARRWRSWRRLPLQVVSFSSREMPNTSG